MAITQLKVTQGHRFLPTESLYAISY